MKTERKCPYCIPGIDNCTHEPHPVEAPAAQEKWEPKVGDKVMMGDKIETIEEVTSGSTPYRLKGWGGFIAKSLIRPAPSTDNPSRILTPEELTKLCSNQTPHRADGWKAEWLPEGTRPLLGGEQVQEGDEYLPYTPSPVWTKCDCVPVYRASAHQGFAHHRTSRPLPPSQPATAKTAGEAAYNEYWKTASEPLPFHLVRNDLRIEWERTAQAVLAFASSAETQELPSVEEFVKIYKEAKRAHWLGGANEMSDAIAEGISAVREAILCAIGDSRGETLGHTIKSLEQWKSRAEAAEQKVKQLEDAMFDKEQAINREAEAIGRAVSAEQTADALRREVEREHNELAHVREERNNAIKELRFAIEQIGTLKNRLMTSVDGC